MDKIKLLKKICNFYDYEIKEQGGKYVIDNGVSDYSLNFVNVKSECGHFEYENIDEALIDWLITLKDTDKECMKTNRATIWKDEIDFIKIM